MSHRSQPQITSGPTVAAWLGVAGMIVGMTTSQVLFKYAGMRLAAGESSSVRSWVVNPWLWSAGFSTLLGTIAWTAALRRLPLSVAYPWTASIYVATPLLSTWLFNDPIGLRYGVAMVLIVAGIVLTTSSVKAQPCER